VLGGIRAPLTLEVPGVLGVVLVDLEVAVALGLDGTPHDQLAVLGPLEAHHVAFDAALKAPGTLVLGVAADGGGPRLLEVHLSVLGREPDAGEAGTSGQGPDRDAVRGGTTTAVQGRRAD